jgi:hypothetical protein
MELSFKPISFDSLGAKSSCTLIKTPDVKILIDPGIAVMQPSFPASSEKKIYWEKLGKEAIKKASKDADVIIISHYHYDHFFPDDLSIYSRKKLFAKNPNEYINDSQRRRAEHFFQKICEKFGKVKLNEVVERRRVKNYSDPMKKLPIAREKNFHSYQERRKELLKKGKEWFSNLAKNWNSWLKIPELKFSNLRIRFPPEGKEFKFGKKTKLRFSKPLFHGIEYSRVGWVFSTIIEYGEKEKLIHTSDLSGIYIEDYAYWLIKENPQVLIADGPPTYMYGYYINKINLQRCISNTCKIIKKTKNLKLMIYDHHLLREKKYKERTKKVWTTGKMEEVKVMTAAEFLGKKPVVLSL